MQLFLSPLFGQATPQNPWNQGFDLVWKTVRDLLAGFFERLPYLLMGVVVFFIFVLLGRLARRIIRNLSDRTDSIDATLASLLGRIVGTLLVIIGVLISAVVIFPTFLPGDLLAGLGITSVAIGFAFKDILQNFFAGLLIMWRRPFKIGDQIRVLDFDGTVEDINMRSTRLKTYDGERAILPNGQVYTSTILVRTAYDRRRLRFVVGIGYGDSIDEARQVIHRVLDGIDGVLPEPGPWVYVSELAPSSVNLTVYFWVHSPQANALKVSDEVATKIKLALDEAGIDMPYPHTVVHTPDLKPDQRTDVESAKGDPAA